jgi:hypothetical protein
LKTTIYRSLSVSLREENRREEKRRGREERREEKRREEKRREEKRREERREERRNHFAVLFLGKICNSHSSLQRTRLSVERTLLTGVSSPHLHNCPISTREYADFLF